MCYDYCRIKHLENHHWAKNIVSKSVHTPPNPYYYTKCFQQYPLYKIVYQLTAKLSSHR